MVRNLAGLAAGAIIAIANISVGWASPSAATMREGGYALGVAELAALRARQAKELGVDGLILSPLELARIRALVGPKMLLVTPGVRPAGAEANDQKRVMTPGQAILAGADHLVIGRPITRAADPRAAAERIVAEIAGAA